MKNHKLNHENAGIRMGMLENQQRLEGVILRGFDVLRLAIPFLYLASHASYADEVNHVQEVSSPEKEVTRLQCPNSDWSVTVKFVGNFRYEIQSVNEQQSIDYQTDQFGLDANPVPLLARCLAVSGGVEAKDQKSFLVLYLGPWVDQCDHCDQEIIFDETGARSDVYSLSLYNSSDGYDLHSESDLARFEYGPRFETIIDWLANLK